MKKNEFISNMPNTKTKILIIDDHEVVRAGVKNFLIDLLPHSVINEAWDGHSCLDKIRDEEYHLVILDINIPGTDSIGLINAILALRPKTNILMFSLNADEIYAKRYLQLGVKGYLNKNAPRDEITRAIKTVLEGKKYISPALKEAIINDMFGENNEDPFKTLSPREFQILQHLISGKSSADIISTLNLTSSTVGTYKARILKKLNCKNVMELNVLAKLYNISPQ
jgi:two-component system invasion response regulator UvrY